MPQPKSFKRSPRASVERSFYAGQYKSIIRDCVDGGRSSGGKGDLPFVVGALAFVGRLEEARALFSSHLKRSVKPREQRTLVAARFFLAVAYCRAGRMEDARREFLQNARGRHGDRLARFYVFQGLGCYRYFTGRLRQAARQALSALEYAFAADFPYGRFLATDLRGHTLVLIGQVRAGLSLLETARALAESLALVGNVAALDCAIAVYRARFGVIPIRDAIEEIKTVLLRAPSEDSYSERLLRTELAIQYALAGEGDTAWGLLESLGMEHVPDGGDVRARLRFLLACANVARLRHGSASMQPFVSEARALLHNKDDSALEFDVLCMELLDGTSEEAASAVRAELRALQRRSGIERIWLARAERAEAEPLFATVVEAIEEDRIGALYWACRHRSNELASRLLASGYWGLLPLALGLAPGRRLLVLDGRLVIGDEGNVMVVADPSEQTLRLLRALADGKLHSKAELLEVVWGITAYRPDAHDAVIHTAVSRLRAQFSVRGHWVQAVGGGYRLASGVTLLELGEVQRLLARSEPPSGDAAQSDRRYVPAAPSVDPIVELLTRRELVSSGDVASLLGVSEMTALRRLREHVEQGLVERCGNARGTRYRLPGRSS